MVEAYMDESGIHDGAHVCVVAGYWAMRERWRRFEHRWREILKNTNTLEVKEFHAREFYARTPDGKRIGPYADWTDDKADTFITDLADCIVKSKIAPMAATLVTDDWLKLNKNERMFLTGGRYDKAQEKFIGQSAPNKRYFLPFQFCVVYPAKQCMPGLTVRYFFDLNKQFKNHATDLFARIKTDPNVTSRPRIGGLSFEESHNATGLQAADLLAYEMYQFSKLRIAAARPLRKSDMSPILQTIMKNARDMEDFPFLDFEGLNVCLHNLPTHLRSEGWHPVTLKNASGAIG